MNMIIQLCTCVLLICLTANAQLQTTKLDSGSTLGTGHGASSVKLGVVDAKEEDWAALLECNNEMERMQKWRNKIIPLEVLQRKGYWKYYESHMQSAIAADHVLLNKMNNYTSYMTPDLTYRGPSKQEDPTFETCDDLCPTKLQTVGAIYHDKLLCFIIDADKKQDLKFKQCTSVIAENVKQSYNDVFAFVNRVACVPDSFIEKRVVAFCPQTDMRQCRDLVIRLPLSCSPKFAKCQLTREAMYRKNSEKRKNRKRLSFLSKFRKGGN